MKLARPTRTVLLATLLAAFSLATLAASEPAAAPTPTPSMPATAKPPAPKPQLKPAPEKKPQPGKTRGLKSKKKKECNGKDYCE